MFSPAPSSGPCRPWACGRAAGQCVCQLLCFVLQCGHVPWRSTPAPEGAGIPHTRRAGLWLRCQPRNLQPRVSTIAPIPEGQVCKDPRVCSSSGLQDVQSYYENKAKKALMGNVFRLPSRSTFPALCLLRHLPPSSCSCGSLSPSGKSLQLMTR